MKEINLRKYYPHYTQDMIVSIPDEVAELLQEFKRAEDAQRIRTYSSICQEGKQRGEAAILC